jgi:hypothetical protein
MLDRYFNQAGGREAIDQRARQGLISVPATISTRTRSEEQAHDDLTLLLRRGFGAPQCRQIPRSRIAANSAAVGASLHARLTRSNLAASAWRGVR